MEFTKECPRCSGILYYQEIRADDTGNLHRTYGHIRSDRELDSGSEMCCCCWWLEAEDILQRKLF